MAATGRKGDESGRGRPPTPFFPERLVWWLSFQLLLAFSPLLFAALSIRGPGWNDTIIRGEMILIAVVLTGSDVGGALQLVATSPWRRTARAAIIGFGSLFCIIGAFLFADIRSSVENQAVEVAHAMHSRVYVYSYSLVPLAVGIGVGSSYLVHIEDVIGRRYENE
jgi:hypothetical protein